MCLKEKSILILIKYIIIKYKAFRIYTIIIKCTNGYTTVISYFIFKKTIFFRNSLILGSPMELL